VRDFAARVGGIFLVGLEVHLHAVALGGWQRGWSLARAGDTAEVEPASDEEVHSALRM